MPAYRCIVVTADRPARLRGTGANQTTDQVGIFGHAVRTFDVVGADVARSRLVPSGPVHLNVQLDDPLLPDGPLDARGAPTGRGNWTSRDRATTPTSLPARPAHRGGGRRRRRPAGPGPGRAGRLAAVRRAEQRVPQRARTRSAPTGCCSDTELGSQHRAGRRVRPPDAVPPGAPGCWPATTSRCLGTRAAGRWPERPFPVTAEHDASDRRRRRPGLARGVARRPTATSRQPARRVRRRRSPTSRRTTWRRRSTPHPPGRGPARRRRQQPDPRPRPDGPPLPGRRAPHGAGQPGPGRHRRHRLDRDRRRPRPSAQLARDRATSAT